MYRIVWRMSPDAMGDISTLDIAMPFPKEKIFQKLDLPYSPLPVFPETRLSLRTEKSELPEGYSSDERLDLAAYGHIFIDNQNKAKQLMESLSSLPEISWVDIQSPIERPVIFSESRFSLNSAIPALPLDASPDFSKYQNYLDAAPTGIDARFAWNISGGKGLGIRIIDIESGWNFNHEDLLSSIGGVVHGPNTNHDHGTAVLGIYAADHNGIGINGISPDAVAMAMSAEWDDYSQQWNAAAAIHAASKRLSPGDVIILEMQAPGPESKKHSQDGYVPIEYWEDNWAAIRLAVLKGIHVVEAAGNGGIDLDKSLYSEKMNLAEQDSGAIMVGAGESCFSYLPGQALWFSNFGQRVNLQAWGEHIVTTGGKIENHYCDLWNDPDPGRCYTQNFGGTSGASSIVAGCIASIEGIRKNNGLSPLDPFHMRKQLEETGTDFGGPIHIGPMPDLKSFIQQMLESS